MNSCEVGKVWEALLFKHTWQSVSSEEGGGGGQSGRSEDTHAHTSIK